MQALAKSELASPTPAPPSGRDVEPPDPDPDPPDRNALDRILHPRERQSKHVDSGAEHHGYLRGEAYDDYVLPDFILPPPTQLQGSVLPIEVQQVRLVRLYCV